MIREMVGSSIGGFRLQRILGEGGFAVVFAGEREGSGDWKAFKIGKTGNESAAAAITQVCEPTHAWVAWTGLWGKTQVNSKALLRAQFEWLQAAGPEIAPAVDRIWDEADYCAIEMEMMDGTLRRKMLDGAVTDAVLRNLGDVLAQLERRGLLHGDLKPENILTGPGAGNRSWIFRRNGSGGRANHPCEGDVA